MKNTGLKKWSDFYKKGSLELSWPSETLIRLFKGDYVPGLDPNFRGKKIVDVGFGNANNLIFFGSLGLDLSGTEITKVICKETTEKLKTLGYEADLRAGTNRKIPFPDNSFDFLVS